VLNVKTRKLYVKLVNATDDEKEADINLSRFPLKKQAVKTILTGAPDAENNFDQQPIAPKTETIKAQKKFDIDLPPYSMVMLEYSL
jgi:alpha-L-arabinofuranosidase